MPKRNAYGDLAGLAGAADASADVLRPAQSGKSRRSDLRIVRAVYRLECLHARELPVGRIDADFALWQAQVDVGHIRMNDQPTPGDRAHENADKGHRSHYEAKLRRS